MNDRTAETIERHERRGRARETTRPPLLDTELEHLPPELRWREWMGRVEAVIFASAEPVSRKVLAKVVGRNCDLDLIIEDIRAELVGRPYELVAVAGGFQHRTLGNFSDAIRTALGSAVPEGGRPLTKSEALVLMTIAYFQPITRGELSTFFGREISRDLIAALRSNDFIASGPRSPTPGAPYTYVTTRAFLAHFGLDTLRDLPDFEALEDAGLLSKDKLLAGDVPVAMAGSPDDDEE
ncbi:SMC-Scp complex subunit ScpB [Mesorhizobium sp. SP-1A]|uniref:SMC-Scp complex subunit ScpB n=1 Tax=Mesorhizobium sp. SP-1A TaxID=3077840 RepID=UPI0028F71CF6|nr:SMC-Scp complex subunit ScpB [Mesorhizobium sp. SP-1A]